MNTYDGWTQVKSLGNGSFGSITLWKNVDNNTEMALKVSNRTRENLKQKQVAYWTEEVKMMYSLNHPNIVGAIVVPDSLQKALHKDLPVLGMEYCSGGSLRNIMRETLNLMGLEERVVRFILHDICEGLSYLHSKSIIHRDIKPENIVVKKGTNSRDIFKIIDLGYSKELLQTNHAESFVGTVVYLAPEIASGLRYDVTADYWSLGVLAFEIASGIRPFFHGSSEYMQKIRDLRTKSRKIIYIREKSPGVPEMLSTLPDWCCLSDDFKKAFTEWLYLMLSYEPASRNPTGDISVRPNSLDIMLSVLRKKVVKVLDVAAKNTLVLSEESSCFDLYTKTMIPQKEQLIITWDGVETSFDTFLKSCVEDEGRTHAFVLQIDRKNFTLRFAPYDRSGFHSRITDTRLMKKSRLQVLIQTVRELEKLRQTSKSFIILTEIIQKRYVLLAATHRKVDSTFKRLEELVALLRKSRDYDNEQSSRSYHSSMDDLKFIVSNMIDEQQMKNLSGSLSELQLVTKCTKDEINGRQSIASINASVDNLGKLESDLLTCYQSYRAEPNKPQDEFLQILDSITNEGQKAYDTLNESLVCELDLLKRIRSGHERLAELGDIITERLEELHNSSLARDRALWNIIKTLLLERKSSGNSRMFSVSPDIVSTNERHRSELDKLMGQMKSECQTFDEYLTEEFPEL